MKIFQFLAVCLLLSGCGNSDSAPLAKKQKVIVCTTGILADVVRQFADSAEVVALMGPGTDPHLFKPTKATLDDLARADVIVANGLHLEGRMQDVLEKFSDKKAVVFAGDALDKSQLLYGDAARTIPDPHIWMNAALWANVAAHIATELDVLLYVNAGAVEAYIDQLLALDVEIAERMQTIPEEQRVLVTAHDAFQYFGEAYGVEVVGLQGISTQSDYGVRDVTDMVDMLVDRKVKAVFVESSISDRSMKAVAEGTARQGWNVALGGTLYTDALGGSDSGADTYVGMMRANVLTIYTALK